MFAPRLLLAFLALTTSALSAPSTYPSPPSSAPAALEVPANIANYNNIAARSVLGGREAYHPFHTPEFREGGRGHGQGQGRKRMNRKQKQKKRGCAVPKPKPSSSSTVPGQNGVVVPTSTLGVPVVSSTTAGVVSSSTAPAAPSSAAPTSATPATPAPPSSGFNSPDREGNGPFSGQSTYYVLGTDGKAVGACGTNLVDSDLIAAASEYLFDSWPGANGNPNQNPICGQFAKVSYQGKSVVVRIADRCPGCEKRHLDLSPSAFTQLAPESVGMMDVTWEWVGSASG